MEKLFQRDHRIRTILITGYGINAERELAEAFRRVGCVVEAVHLGDLLQEPDRILRAQILALPGGFSFGDHLGSGKVLAHILKQKLKDRIERFVQQGGLVLGICNGFQILVKMGILPNVEGSCRQEVSLIHNENGMFVDRWVKVSFNSSNPSPWIRGLSEEWYPIRHGEGRFITGTTVTGETLRALNLIALTYAEENPNGSELGIAGITDRTGRILGMMPHPEAFLIPENHPLWPRKKISPLAGLQIFRNGFEYARETG
jgi:phosphoribosylformylglycinamidine (FGAM) synthase-like amidotransferase family enzyme